MLMDGFEMSRFNFRISVDIHNRVDAIQYTNEYAHDINNYARVQFCSISKMVLEICYFLILALRHR